VLADTRVPIGLLLVRGHFVQVCRQPSNANSWCPPSACFDKNGFIPLNASVRGLAPALERVLEESIIAESLIEVESGISAVKALWEPHISTRVWALTAPDGKHVAMPLDLQHVNVWMMENF
jgi:hypothetical protein